MLLAEPSGSTVTNACSRLAIAVSTAPTVPSPPAIATSSGSSSSTRSQLEPSTE